MILNLRSRPRKLRGTRSNLCQVLVKMPLEISLKLEIRLLKPMALAIHISNVKHLLKMAEQIKNSETKIISDCGHMIIFEKAFEMRKLVKEFISK